MEISKKTDFSRIVVKKSFKSFHQTMKKSKQAFVLVVLETDEKNFNEK